MKKGCVWTGHILTGEGSAELWSFRHFQIDVKDVLNHLLNRLVLKER